MRGVRGNPSSREQALKWVTKSTKDYMKEGSDGRAQPTAAPGVVSERHTSRVPTSERKEEYKEVRDAAETMMEQELLRMRDEGGKRWKKSISFFKRQGKGFIIMYTAMYFGSLLALYVGFSSGFLSKEAAFEYMFFFIGRYVEKDAFYQRIEAWGDQIDFGFAFVINEMLEVIRFPLVMFLFYQLRPLLARAAGKKARAKSIFRMNAAES